MKKTFQVNINGKIYHIDEDAYTLLQNYLSQLRDAFPGEEGQEIVGDIESRISEHFDQRIASGVLVIVIDDVNHVISIMGRPDEISDEAGFEADTHSEGSRPAPAPAPAGSQSSSAGVPPYTGTTPPPFSKKLFRDERHKVFGGVLAGLAQYLNWDVTVLRILTVVATISLAGWGLFWSVILIYLVCWMVIPAARTPRQILEMRGEPVTVDNVGQTVINNAEPPVAPVPQGNGAVNFINNIFLVVGRVILVILGFVSGIVGLSTAIVGLVVIAGICCLYFASSESLLSAFDISMATPYLEGWGIALILFSVALPAFCLCRVGIGTLFKAPGMSLPAVVAVIVLEVLMIIGACVLMNLSDSYCYATFDSFASSTVHPVIYALPALALLPIICI